MISEMREWVIRIDQIPTAGTKQQKIASQSVCAVLADALDLRSVSELHVDYEILPKSKGGFQLAGRVRAGVVQSCVVTLDPLEVRLDEAFEVRFLPEADFNDVADGEEEILSGPISVPITNGVIDVGAQVYEVMSASLDPYPRKDGVVFDAGSIGANKENLEEEAGPFAALSKLKGDREA